MKPLSVHEITDFMEKHGMTRIGMFNNAGQHEGWLDKEGRFSPVVDGERLPDRASDGTLLNPEPSIAK